MSMAQHKQVVRRNAQHAAVSQMDLFAAPRPVVPKPAPAISAMVPVLTLFEDTDVEPAATNKKFEPVARTRVPATRAPANDDIRITTEADMPPYADFDREAVERTLMSLPATKVWFTYAAVRECFGISRATVARRVKEGLVPGIRFCGSNVLEDGTVRRFDRTQVRWLLLATRKSREMHVAQSRKNFQKAR